MAVAGPIIGAVGSIAGGSMGARGAADAAEAQTQGQRDAIAAQLAMFNQSRADMLPMIQARNSALPIFMQLLGLSPSSLNLGTSGAGGIQIDTVGASNNDRGWTEHFQDQLGIPGVGSIDSNPINAIEDTLRTPFENFGDWDGSNMADNPGRLRFRIAEAQANQTPAPAAQPLDLQALIAATPGYQFQLGQGMQAIDRSAAARGGLMSGATIKAAQRYGTGLASQEFGNYANRLASLIGLGQTAAATAGGFGQQTGANIGQNLANIGAARGSGYANQANIWGNAIGGAANAFGNYYGNQQTTAVPGGGAGPYNQNAWMNYGYGGGG